MSRVDTHLHNGDVFAADKLGDLVRPMADQRGRAHNERGLMLEVLRLALHMTRCMHTFYELSTVLHRQLICPPNTPGLG